MPKSDSNIDALLNSLSPEELRAVAASLTIQAALLTDQSERLTAVATKAAQLAKIKES